MYCWENEHHVHDSKLTDVCPEHIRDAYRLLLGRAVEGIGALDAKRHLHFHEMLVEILNSDEFSKNIQAPLRASCYSAKWLFDGAPKRGLLKRVAASWPLSDAGIAEILEVISWRGALSALWRDPTFKDQILRRTKEPDDLINMFAHLNARSGEKLSLPLWAAIKMPEMEQ